jgi:lipid A ethanolaminephosphotransferase
MGLRLFHITEFAESSMFTPATQRESMHPFALMLLISLWVALAGNLPLWQRLWSLPGLGGAQLLWITIILALMMTCALGMLSSLLNWRFVVKLALTVLLLLSAVNTDLLFKHGKFIDAALLHRPLSELKPLMDWQLLLLVTALGLIPSFWVWRVPLRRMTFQRNLTQNMIFFTASCALLVGLLLISLNNVAPQLRTQPQLRHLLNPFNSLHAFGEALSGKKLQLP